MEKSILNLISVFGWNGPYIVSCCNAMFGTGNFVLVQNLVEYIKILYLKLFSAICDLFGAPFSQTDVKKLLGIKVLIQVLIYTRKWTNSNFTLFSFIFGNEGPPNGHRWLQMVSISRFWCPLLDFGPKQNFLYQT